MRSTATGLWKEGNNPQPLEPQRSMYWVYILRCSDGSYYTGSTSDLQVRVAEHNAGTFGGYTAGRRPVTLVFSQETPSQDEAFRFEHQVKGWSRKKKEALIAGRWDLLPELSRSRNSRA